MGVDKKILEQYVDACEMIRETEQDIKRLKRKRQTIVPGSVKGWKREGLSAASLIAAVI